MLDTPLKFTDGTIDLGIVSLVYQGRAGFFDPLASVKWYRTAG